MKFFAPAVAFVLTAVCAPTAVNATYTDQNAWQAPLSQEAMAARKAYAERLSLEARSDAITVKHTRKRLVAVVASLQAACDARCVLLK